METADFKIERALTFKRASEIRKGKATISNVRFSDDHMGWLCDASIDYLEANTVTFEGDDALQAINHSLFFFSEVILGATEGGWSVWWQEEGDHGCFTKY